MYLRFYGLNRKPFHTTPDPYFLFLSPTHREALSSIIYGIEQRKGFIAIIGEVGTGKTSILRAYLERKNTQKQKTIYIFNPVLSFHELLIAIFRGLELVPRHDDVPEMVNQLHEALVTEFQARGTVVLAIDEAQNMPVETLENLRMLSNLETSTDKLIQIILLGQPELDNLLKQPVLRQLRQRITIRATIRPLSNKESLAYVQHRLAKSSIKQNPIFTRGALRIIVREAKGIPRRLNSICDSALITGIGYQAMPITEKIVREVIADLEGKQTLIFGNWISMTAATVLILGIMAWVLSIESDISLSSKVEGAPKIRTTQANRNDDVSIDGKNLEKVLSQRPSLQEEKKGSVNLQTNVLEKSLKPSSHLEEHQPLSDNPKGTHTKNTQANSNTPLVIRTIKKGDTLDKLITTVYGASNPERVKWILDHNPHIHSPQKMFPGQDILFPQLPQEIEKMG